MSNAELTLLISVSLFVTLCATLHWLKHKKSFLAGFAVFFANLTARISAFVLVISGLAVVVENLK